MIDPLVRFPAHTHDAGYSSISPSIFSKGTSRRIFGELYKVLDSSDVIVHVLDARDPEGTMCSSVIDWIRQENPHKQLVFLINKIDLVPTWVTVSLLQPHRPRGRIFFHVFS